MSKNIFIDDRHVISRRGIKNRVDPSKPYGWLVEKEYKKGGTVEDTGVIFLANPECPFHCLMCDLWKNTTDEPVPPGAIPSQIEYALSQMPEIRHLKIYNSGSFFDNRAIPRCDYSKIASLLANLDSVIVECHPKLVNESCPEFRDMLKPELQVALGLETVNPEILALLNKKMDTDDFSKSVKFLSDQGIDTRAFILLRPPFMSREEGIFWACRSIDFAFGNRVECCTIIPVRGGNGVMEELVAEGSFEPPDVRSLEKVTEYGLSLGAGRVFADLWDLDRFSECDTCFTKRHMRLNEMNLTQRIPVEVSCRCESSE